MQDKFSSAKEYNRILSAVLDRSQFQERQNSTEYE